jgi:TolB protein
VLAVIDRRRYRIRRLGLAVVGLMLAALVGAPAALAGGHPAHGRIAYVSDESGFYDIWVMRSDGSDRVDLTNDAAEDLFPAWSPDGSKIAFTHRTAASRFSREIFVMDATGGNRVQLTSNAVADVMPVWSPDGTRIAFVSFGPDEDRDIYVMNADGSGRTDLTVAGGPFDFLPDWSPSGKLIAFMSDRSGSYAIYTMRPDGSHVRQVGPADVDAGSPSWSPDGRLIAFEDNACATCTESDLFVMAANGSAVRQLTDTAGNELTPDWSPDGDRLSFEMADLVGDGLGFSDIAVLDIDDGKVTGLTNSPEVDEFSATWAPEGNH